MKTGNYVIVYLIKGEAKKYQKNLINELSRKFKIKNLNNHIPPHITFKEPFTTNNIKEIEDIITNICKQSKKYPVKIKGFGNFYKKVLFLDVRLSFKARRVYKRLLKELKKVKWMHWGKYDGLGTFHSTIAYTKNKKQFSNIMEYLFGRKPSYNLEFDNITLLKEVGKNWRVYKVFKIN